MFACKVCRNEPDVSGNLEHGKGCYHLHEEGGGTEYIVEADRFIARPSALSVECRVVIAGAAQEAFWKTVAEMLPEAKTGDMDVGAVLAFSRACNHAVEIWARTNLRLPEGEHEAKLVDVTVLPAPKTTDYCKRCGHSPDSGIHVVWGQGAHLYEDPRL